MKRISYVAELAAALFLFVGYANAQSTVYNSLRIPQPPNVPSQGFQCCATSEFGDQITLAGTARAAGSVTVLMSDWAIHSDYPSMPTAGYMHPITLNIYDTAVNAAGHSPLASVTQKFLIPWRPEPDPTCTGGTPWRSPTDNVCYNGFAFTITFDLRHAGPGGSPVLLPDSLIFGVAYNTQTWGYTPLGVPGPYESLNVGLNNLTPPSVGIDVDPDAVFWNTKVATFYTDGGAAGVGTFRKDTAWAPYVPAVQFSTFTFATTADSCKNGGWEHLVRRDFSGFKNQGDCVSYTQNGK